MPKLIAAVQAGDIDQVKKIVEELELVNANFIDEKDRLGMTSLMWACAAGRIDIAAYLLEHKANVNMQADGAINGDFITGKGKTALMFACGHGSIELVRLLLDYKADASIIHAVSNFSALTIAVDSRNLAVVKLLVESSSSIDVNMKSYAFYHASISGYIEVMQYLQAQGAQINAIFGTESALISVAKCGSLDLVASLLDMGAEVNIRAMYNIRPLLVALQNGRADVAKLLLGRGALDHSDSTCSSLMLAARNGNLSIVRLLLTKKSLSSHYINLRNEDGQSALMFALHNGHEEVVRFLLNCGASIKYIDNLGRGAVMFAVQSGNIELVKLVINQECEINLVDRYRNSPIMLAVSKDQIEITKLLIGCGACLRYVDIVMRYNKLSDEIVKLVEATFCLDNFLNINNLSLKTPELEGGEDHSEFLLECAEMIVSRIIYRLTKTTMATNTVALEEYLTKYIDHITPESFAQIQEAIIVYKLAEVLYTGASFTEPLPILSEAMIERICKCFEIRIEIDNLENFDLMRKVVSREVWPKSLAQKIIDIIEARDVVYSETDDEDWPGYSGEIEGSIIASVITSLHRTSMELSQLSSEPDSIIAIVGEVDSMV